MERVYIKLFSNVELVEYWPAVFENVWILNDYSFWSCLCPLYSIITTGLGNGWYLYEHLVCTWTNIFVFTYLQLVSFLGTATAFLFCICTIPNTMGPWPMTGVPRQHHNTSDNAINEHAYSLLTFCFSFSLRQLSFSRLKNVYHPVRK